MCMSLGIPYRDVQRVSVQNRFLISTVMWARFPTLHWDLGLSWGVVDQLAQAAFLPDLGLTIVEVDMVSRWRGVPLGKGALN